MKDKILEAVQISKTYGEGESAVQALKASDLTIWKGEFASIIGSSGSGKSTLLKILGGLLPPTTGNVLLDGQDLYAMNAEQLAQVRRQKIGFIFQDFRLFPEYTVRDNILIPFYLDHRTPDEQMLCKLTEILGIAEKLDALLQRLELTSRMKDIYDIYYLSSMFDFDGMALQQAIFETLQNRGTAYERDSFDRVIALADNKNIQVRWRQYLRRLKMPELALDDVMHSVDSYLRPVWDAIINESELTLAWHSQSGAWKNG